MTLSLSIIINNSSSEKEFLQIFQTSLLKSGESFEEAYEVILKAYYQNPTLAPKIE